MLNDDQHQLLEKAREKFQSLLDAENARFISQDQKDKIIILYRAVFDLHKAQQAAIAKLDEGPEALDGEGIT